MLGLYVKSSNLLIIVMYRPPDDRIGGHCSTHIEFRQALSKLHDTLQDLPTPTPDIILCGDFNLPNAIWPGGGVKVGAARDEQIMIKDLLAFTDELFLVQEIQKPTHRKGNTLDLLFTNNPEFLHSYECVETIYSDHFMIEGCVNYNKENESEKVPAHKPCLITGFDQLNFFREKKNWRILEEEFGNFG